MAISPTAWADSLRASIAQMAGAMREIENMEHEPEWDPYFDGWMADPSISKDTRKTIKNLLPAVISMAEDIDDDLLSQLGINTAALPSTSPFSANQDIEASDLRIAQIDMLASPSETAHAVLVITKPTRTVKLAIYDMTGLEIMPDVVLIEVLSGTFVYQIDWSQLPVQDGYYIVQGQDEYEMDAKIVEIKTPRNKSHTQADEVWMLQNIQGSTGGGGGSAPSATADGRFV